jgi:hypothetical protein
MQYRDTSLLDVEELFHLALHANGTGERHACISYLREVLQQEPRHAPALYMLAIQHATLGLSQRAASGIKAAIESGLDGKARDMARFQLGVLLLLDVRSPAEAKEQFAQLDSCDDPALCIYAGALTALADGDPKRCVERLRLGLARHSAENPPLSAHMQQLLERLEQTAPPSAAEPAATTPQQSSYLGAYGRSS